MVGGKVEAMERCRPLLDAIATTIVHVGDSGAGQVCKACNQMCVAVTMQAAAEAMALAKAMAVDPYRVRDALLGGAAKSVVLERHTKKLLDGDFTPGFRTVLMAKDLGIALEATRGGQVFAPAASLVEQMLRALIASGHGEDDWCSLGAMIQSLSGVQGESADESHHD
jgi:2-hydroxy-3-oxopropionate reductase